MRVTIRSSKIIVCCKRSFLLFLLFLSRFFKNLDKNNKNNKNDRLQQTIILLDRIVTRIQELIFHHTKNICFSLIETNNYDPVECKPDIYNKDPYRILVDLLHHNSFFMNKSFTDHELISLDIKQFFKSM